MTKLKIKITAGVLSLALATSIFAPAGAMAATNVTVSGNGTDSINKVKIKNIKKTSIKQKNNSSIINSFSVTQSTDGNNANNNTGGDVTVTSGNSTATVNVTNMTGGNFLMWDDSCGCIPQDTTVDITDNGKDSQNEVKVINKDITKLTQKNSVSITNSISVNQSSGENDANNNTGGNVSITSGDTHAEITVDNTTGDNVIENANP